MRSSDYMMLLRLEQSHMPESRSDSDTVVLKIQSELRVRRNRGLLRKFEGRFYLVARVWLAIRGGT